MYFKYIGLQMVWVHIDQNRDRGWTFVKTQNDLKVPQNVENFLIS